MDYDLLQRRAIWIAGVPLRLKKGATAEKRVVAQAPGSGFLQAAVLVK
jgi:hypothetical protein